MISSLYYSNKFQTKMLYRIANQYCTCLPFSDISKKLGKDMILSHELAHFKELVGDLY
jgi:hypothetical protein